MTENIVYINLVGIFSLMHYDLLLSSPDIVNLPTFQKSLFFFFVFSDRSIFHSYDMILSCILVTKQHIFSSPSVYLYTNLLTDV
jgi:hypothetical protein